MENKYYTPEIDEFYVGVECETNEDGEWEYYRIKKYTSLLELDKLLKLGGVRVKYLDKEDIESLGWGLVNPENSNHVFGLGVEYEYKCENGSSYWLRLDQFEDGVTIKIHNGSDWEDNHIYADVKIKNKAELKKLMKQIGIK